MKTFNLHKPLFYIFLWLSVLVYIMIMFKPDYSYLEAKKHYPWLNKERYNYIITESMKNNIPHQFTFAVIQYESGTYCANDWDYMTRVVSWAGARGVMQIMPFHAKEPNILFYWKMNIKKGCWYLGLCLKFSNGNMREAARRYNQGIYGKRWRYKNWAYVNRIMRKYNKAG